MKWQPYEEYILMQGLMRFGKKPALIHATMLQWRTRENIKSKIQQYVKKGYI